MSGTTTMVVGLTLVFLILLACIVLVRALRGNRAATAHENEEIKDLLTTMFGKTALAADTLQRLSTRSGSTSDHKLEDALVDYFSYTRASRSVLKALVNSDGPLRFKNILEVSFVLTGPRKKITEKAIKATVYILMGAGFVEMPQADEFVITDLGKNLHERIRNRKNS